MFPTDDGERHPRLSADSDTSRPEGAAAPSSEDGINDGAHVADAAALVSEERFRRILDAVPEPVTYIDAEQRFRFNNRAYDAWLGRPRRELRGQHVREVLGEQFYEEIRPHLEQALAGREAQYESELTYPDGSRRYINATYVPDLDSHGVVRGIIATIKDLTQRKRAEVALVEAERRAVREYETLIQRLTQLAESLGTAREHIGIFRELKEFSFASVPCIGIFISLYNPERDVRVARYAWGDGVEVDVSSLPPMPVSSEGPNSRAVRTGQVVITNNYWELKLKGQGQLGVLVGPDNGLRPQSSLVVPMQTMGRMVGAIEVQSYENEAFHDEHITAMRMAANLAAVAIENMRLLEHESAARAAAEESNRLKDEFLATLSHELRTPLTSILGWSNMLLAGKMDEETTRGAMQSIERNARMQHQIVNDLLDVSRIITGNLRFEPQPTDVRAVVLAAIDTVRPAADAKNIALRAEFDPRADPVMGDAARLQQVAWNLLANAVKFTPAGGEVRVSIERAGERLRFTVADTGDGIRADFLPYVFDRFRQGDQSSTRRYGGLGLGLSIVRHLVELHGGTVRAASDGEGRGATFIVELPLPRLRIADVGAEIGGRVQSLEKQTAPLAGLRALVVDDEPDALELVRVILERAGADVTTVGNADGALEALRRARADVLLCDIGMPGEDGYQLLRRVREFSAEEGGEMIAIALTAYAGDANRARALEAGFQLHLAKPIDAAQLVNIIANLAGASERA